MRFLKVMAQLRSEAMHSKVVKAIYRHNQHYGLESRKYDTD